MGAVIVKSVRDCCRIESCRVRIGQEVTTDVNAYHSMNSLQRKPRVFLSHSKKDVDFVRRLEADLRACQCDTWIDEVEIRHGKPWLEQIFEAGMPSCEIVLCYITENSIRSEMVKKEIDARLIERLANDRVTLLVYVASADLRKDLRIDLQALQIPIFNSENYYEVLPKIISEIWRSFADAAIIQAVQTEKIRRLELELELRDLQDSSKSAIFSDSEGSEFNEIWRRINVCFDVSILAANPNDPVSAEVKPIGACAISYGLLFRQVVCAQKIKPAGYTLTERIVEGYLVARPSFRNYKNVTCELPFDFEEGLLSYGFLQRVSRQLRQTNSVFDEMIQQRFELVFTGKFDRFRFWLDCQFGPIEKDQTILIEEK